MRELLLQFSTPALVLLIVGGGALFAMGTTFLVRRVVDEKMHQANNEVAGFMFAGVAAIYGVLLAFMVLVVWQEYEEARVNVEEEANTVVNIFRLGQELPEPAATLVQTSAMEYTRNVINDEWTAMQNGQSSKSVDVAVEKLWELHRQLDDANAQPLLHQEQFFKLLDELGNTRRIRLLASRSEIPPLLYLLLISGAFVTIGFTLFFRAPNFRAHLMMSGLFAGLVAFVLLLIIELDNPFLGEIRVHPVAFEQTLDLLNELSGK